MPKPTTCGSAKASRKSASTSSARKTISGRWATPAPAARAARSITTWASVASDQGHTECEFGCECGRYVEIWNLVFMQFDRMGRRTRPIRTRRKYERTAALPKPSIDTGAGLERVTVCAARRYIELRYRSIHAADQARRGVDGRHHETRRDGRPGRPAEQSSAESSHGAASLRVIADHSRAATFLISDGVVPSNEGRGYVLRKIIRRAITHGRLLGQTKPFLNQMVFAVRDLMQDAYPELIESAERVSKTVLAEETRFAHTLGPGLQRLEEDLRRIR